MTKIIGSFVILATLLPPFNVSAQQQTASQDFPTLNARAQFSGGTTISVSTGARFVDNLIGDEALTAMDNEERKLGYASVYEYSYTFKNTGNKKVRVLFSDRDLLMSPLIHYLQDFYITLEPNEEKTVKFLANTTPREVMTDMAVMQFVEARNKWFDIGASAASFWVPRWDALSKEVPY